MSSTGQIVGGVIGAVVGYFAGNPIVGAQIGMTLGGALDPPKLPTITGPRLQDLSVQTSSYGVPLARMYGTVPVVGNVFWLENNRIKEIVRKQEQGGKGGPSQTVKTYSYSATFAVALADTSKTGPILGVRRIWIGSVLWYNNGSDDLETIIASNNNAGGKLDASGFAGALLGAISGLGGKSAFGGARVYLGTTDQEPDPRMQADVGVDDCPAYRNTAYIVFYDLPLGKWSNSLQAAQIKVEVVSAASATEVEVVGELLAKGGSPFGASFAGCAQMLNASGNSFVARHDSATGLIYQDTLRVGGAVTTAVIASTDDYDYVLAGDIDANGSVLLKGSTLSLYVAGDTYSLPALSANGGSVVFRRGGHLLLATPAPGSNTRLTSLDSATGAQYASVVYSGAPQVALSDEYGVVLLEPNGVDVTLLDVETLATSDSFSLDTAFSIVTYGAAYCDAEGMFYVLRDDSGNPAVLVVSLSTQTEVSRHALPVPSGGMSPPSSRIKVNGRLLAWFRNGPSLASPSKIYMIRLPGADPDLVPVADVVSAELQLSGLIEPSDIDVSGLDAELRGYRVLGGPIRGALAPLQGAYPFDLIPSGYQIKAVPRGGAAVATIDVGELGAVAGIGVADVVLDGPSREMDAQLPRKLTIKHLDADRDYDINEQSQERTATDSVDIETQDLPLVLTPDEAAGMAQTLLYLRWLERNDYAAALPPTYNNLEPADVVNIATDYATIPLRVTEINDRGDGVRECRFKPHAAAIYTPNATGGQGVTADGTVILEGGSVLVLLDVPLIRSDLNSPGFIAAMGGDTTGWPGGAAFRSVDYGQTFDSVQGFSSPGTFGIARETLPVDGGFVIDRTSTMLVDMIAGTPESVTEDQILAGYNYYAYGVDDRWEIVAIANFGLQGDGAYQCSTVLRGLYGTEWATGLHTIGDYLVLLDDPDNAFIGAGYGSFGIEQLWRGVTVGASVDDATDQAFTYDGVNLMPLSPVQAAATRDGSNNITATFRRRSRFTDSYWVTGVQPIVGEDSEAYEIDVMSGSTVVRTISATSETFAYSAANQTADGFTPGNAITFRIYQISAAVGRGYALEVTL